MPDHSRQPVIVGAGAKDHSVEALLKADPSASAPLIARFEMGHGRNVKEGVRIAVGQRDQALLVGLPGLNDEVRACVEVLSPGVAARDGREQLASDIAGELREMLRRRMRSHQ